LAWVFLLQRTQQIGRKSTTIARKTAHFLPSGGGSGSLHYMKPSLRRKSDGLAGRSADSQNCTERSQDANGPFVSVPLRERSRRKRVKHGSSCLLEDQITSSNCGFVFGEQVKTLKVLVFHNGPPLHMWLSLDKGSSETVSFVQRALCARLK
jgi:hypothetical protein